MDGAVPLLAVEGIMMRKTPVAATLAALSGAALLALTARFEGMGPVTAQDTVLAEPFETVVVEPIQAPESARILDGFIEIATKGQTAVTHAYPDPGYGWKKPTICWGHTAGVRRGQTATAAECHVFLIEDYHRLVVPAIERCVAAPLAVHEAAALADFIFNVGGGAFCRSSLLKKLNNLDYNGAAEEFPRWVYSNGKRLPGLKTRRMAERALFLEGKAP